MAWMNKKGVFHKFQSFSFFVCVKPAVHYTTFVGRRADGRLNTRNRIVCAYRQQTSAVGTTAFNTSRPDSKNESGRLM